MLIHELLSSLDIHLLAFGRCRCGIEWNYHNVNNYYNRLFLITDGEASVTHHGREYQVPAGSLHLTPCYTSADFICKSGGFDAYYIHFTSRTVGGLDLCRIQEYTWQRRVRELDCFFIEQLQRLNPSSNVPVKDPSDHSYQLYHKKQAETYQQRPPKLYMENMAYISLLLAPFIATGSAATQAEGQRMHAFATYVEENIHHSIALGDIADELDVSPSYLSDWLFKMLRVRPIEYINRRRVEEAQQLLISDKLSIKEIAGQIGFSSPSYFCRVFKNQIGLSASRYRSLYNK
ncbi:MAG: AraC family transcriptional regulator [Kiritimatiellaceae bacterium]|nr:AraC family transcriptional regulator [Kiritimatiellaceae bacterium]